MQLLGGVPTHQNILTKLPMVYLSAMIIYSKKLTPFLLTVCFEVWLATALLKFTLTVFSFSYFISKRMLHSKLEYLDQSTKQLPIAFIFLTKMQPPLLAYPNSQYGEWWCSASIIFQNKKETCTIVVSITNFQPDGLWLLFFFTGKECAFKNQNIFLSKV